MANLTPVSQFDDVYQLEKTDKVEGGANGISNRQAQQLLNRTEYLKNAKIDVLTKGQQNGVASLDSSGLLPYNQMPNFPEKVIVSSSSAIDAQVTKRYIISVSDLTVTISDGITAGQEVELVLLHSCTISHKDINGNVSTENVLANRILKYLWNGTGWFCSSAPEIGSKYEQLSGFDTPESIFGGKWTNKKFGGAFFRSEGGDAKPFTPEFIVISNGTSITFDDSRVPTTSELKVGDLVTNGEEYREVTSINSSGTNVSSISISSAFNDDVTAILICQNDQMQGHKHNDSGHTHTDAGHTHTDAGHTHIDAGHAHSLKDTIWGDQQWIAGSTTHPNWHLNGNAIGAGSSDTYGAQANIQSSNANIQSSNANIQSSNANITTPVNDGTNGTPRTGTETRTKNMTVRIWKRIA